MPASEKSPLATMRIDKWLWAVRIYKTRSLATEACRTGRIRIDGEPVKASREIHPGQEISIHLGIYTKSVRVKDLLHNRVGAALVPQYLDDLTPAEEYEKLKVQNEMKTEFRERGLGRPTKRHRRMIDRLKNFKDFSKDE
jgi:ribosome-associated heat shock protein Hsp15